MRQPAYSGQFKRDVKQAQKKDMGKREVDSSLEDGYSAMAADKAREAEAMDWCNALAGDMVDAAR